MGALIKVIDRLSSAFSVIEEKTIQIPQNVKKETQTNLKSDLNMEPLILTINKLHDVFNTVGGANTIELPQIVVMGTQSAGKSSVIEALVQGSFLPRGTGIVTRRPLVLKLINCPLGDTKYRSIDNGTMELETWGKFHHTMADKIYSDFNEIREEIEMETDRVAGTNKGIDKEPINLTIFSTNVVNLTLVDLPGFTKNPVGDQPNDIESQIKELVMEYIKNPNSIILAVSAANTDLATSEALKIAKDTDPEGIRTLAVLTKLDLMDAGTDATDVLTGSVIPVKLGIIGVVNRSQKSINENKAMEEQLEKEAKFLAQKYPILAAKNGTPYLAKTLSHLLMNHINKCLPKLKTRIHSKMIEFEKLMESYGKAVDNKDQTLNNIVNLFSNAYKATIEGISANMESSGGCGKTGIYKILHEKFERNLKSIDPYIDLSGKDVLSALTNASGPRPTLFNTPAFDLPFEKIVKIQVSQLSIPSLNCLARVHQEMIRNIRNCGSNVQQEMVRFPKLQDMIVDVLTKMLRRQSEIAAGHVSNIVSMEMAYINKKHPDFKIEAALKDMNIENGDGDINRKHKENCDVLEKLIKDYFYIVRKSIQDAVPKAIMHFMVNVIKDEIADKLYKDVYKSPNAEEMLNDSDRIIKGRKHANDMYEAFKRAREIVAEIEISYDAEEMEEDGDVAAGDHDYSEDKDDSGDENDESEWEDDAPESDLE